MYRQEMDWSKLAKGIQRRRGSLSTECENNI